MAQRAFTSPAAFPGAGCVVGVGPHPGAAGARVTSLEQKSLGLGGSGSDAAIALISQEIERMGAEDRDHELRSLCSQDRSAGHTVQCGSACSCPVFPLSGG